MSSKKFLMGNSTKVSGIRGLGKEMALVSNSGLMAPSSKVFGRMTKPMAEAE